MLELRETSGRDAGDADARAGSDVQRADVLASGGAAFLQAAVGIDEEEVQRGHACSPQRTPGSGSLTIGSAPRAAARA